MALTTKTPIQIKYPIFEKRVCQILNEHGFDCARNGASDHGADLICNGVLVEVKGSLPVQLHKNSNRIGFQFLLWKSGYSRRIDEPITILICYQKNPVLFILPLAEIADLNKIDVPNSDPNEYAGKWSRFRERFDLLQEAIRNV
jgi:hypothetical protein